MKIVLTTDSMLGQKSLEQAGILNDVTLVEGIVFTKMDGTDKDRIVCAIFD